MLENINAIQLMLTVVFIVYFSIWFGMQLTSPNGRSNLIQWVKNTLARFMRIERGHDEENE